ncbi:alpha-ketoglutarate-dependent dioxygenase alkB like protein 6 [Ditylenchus destructor]|nr:alpha-ketoglutarate-dependent dioxygenase alkB like protein 6 [Ditylenchus destructor]
MESVACTSHPHPSNHKASSINHMIKKSRTFTVPITKGVLVSDLLPYTNAVFVFNVLLVSPIIISRLILFTFLSLTYPVAFAVTLFLDDLKLNNCKKRADIQLAEEVMPFSPERLSLSPMRRKGKNGPVPDQVELGLRQNLSFNLADSSPQLFPYWDFRLDFNLPYREQTSVFQFIESQASEANSLDNIRDISGKIPAMSQVLCDVNATCSSDLSIGKESDHPKCRNLSLSEVPCIGRVILELLVLALFFCSGLRQMSKKRILEIDNIWWRFTISCGCVCAVKIFVFYFISQWMTGLEESDYPPMGLPIYIAAAELIFDIFDALRTDELKKESDAIIKGLQDEKKAMKKQYDDLRHEYNLPSNRGMYDKNEKWLTKYIDRIYNRPNHVLINAYIAGQGIMAHSDGSAYFPLASTISLGSHTLLHFYKDVDESSGDSENSTPVQRLFVGSMFLEPRSLVLIRDNAYSKLLHAIEETECDNFDEKKVFNRGLQSSARNSLHSQLHIRIRGRRAYGERLQLSEAKVENWGGLVGKRALFSDGDVPSS